ncbi:MAG: hypothetical protein GF405_03245 [Candidatus Eisenbacteria bacterium]|nr:hypothetical protein [Candidatus Eisenbacteria bacterium]
MPDGMPKALRWLLFVIGVGSLVAAGIYLGEGLRAVAAGWGLARALMFLLLGLFFTLMYGEHVSRRRVTRDD